MQNDRKTCKAGAPGMKAPERRYGLLSEEQLEAERQFNIEEAKRNKRAVLAYQREEGRKEGLAEGLAKGEAKGLAKGLAKGKAENARTVAGRMADAGLSPDLIKRITGLDMGI